MSWKRVAALVVIAGCGIHPRFAGLDTGPRKSTLRDHLSTIELDNGLKVALLPDPRSNLVTLDVRYEVGSSDDPQGRGGLAHYVEHVMLEAAYRGPDAPVLRDVPLVVNAFTTFDRTHYWEVGLAVDLDQLLEIEARRMETTCADLEPEKLERERDVIVEEAKTRARWSRTSALGAAIWGAGHPYARPVGGVEAAGASTAEVCAFIESHYSTASATLVVTGSVDANVLSRIRARFERIARRQPVRRPDVPGLPEHGGRKIEVAGLERPAAMMVIPAAPRGSPDEVAAELAGRLISARLLGVRGASATVIGDERARAIIAFIEVTDEGQLDIAVAKLRGAFARFTWNIDEARARLRNQFAEDFDDVYQRGREIADVVARGELGRFRRLKLIDQLQHEQLARALVLKPAHVLTLVPAGGARTHGLRDLVASVHDVAISRAPVDPHEADAPLELRARRVAPQLLDFSLDNGLRVLLAPDPDSIAVDARLVFPVGAASDGGLRGRATLAASLLYPEPLREGARELELARWYRRSVGSPVQTQVGNTTTTFAISGLALYADWQLWNLAYTVLDGRYPAWLDERRATRVPVERKRSELPFAGSIMARRLAGDREDGTRFAWDQIDRSQLAQFRRASYQPRGATLIVSGRFDSVAMRDRVTRLFGSWNASKHPTTSSPRIVRRPQTPSFVAIEDPDAMLVDVALGFAPSRSELDVAVRAARAVTSDLLNDRLRLVRESFGVSYGVHALHSRGILVSGSIEAAHVATALTSVKAELVRMSATDLADDFARARRRVLARALAQPVGAARRADELEEAIRHGERLDFADRMVEAVRTLRLDAVTALIAADLRGERMVVVLRGPRGEVDAGFAALGIDPGKVERVHRDP